MALRASIFHIEMALDGKMDFLKKTNPYGSGEAAAGDPPITESGELDRGAVAAKVKQAFGMFGKERGRP